MSEEEKDRRSLSCACFLCKYVQLINQQVHVNVNSGVLCRKNHLVYQIMRSGSHRIERAYLGMLVLAWAFSL